MTNGADTVGRINISFPITFSLICGIVLVILTFWFWHESQSIKETLIFFGAGVAAASQVAASFYTARILSASLGKDRRDEARERRAETRIQFQESLLLKQQALRFGERWNDPSMYHARDTLRAARDAHAKSAEELKKVIDGNETNVIHIMNFLEEIATSCRHEVVDKEIMRGQFDFIVINTWETLFPWIAERRKKHSPNVWEDVERLHGLWKRP
jgi:hypothetical protein